MESKEDTRDPDYKYIRERPDEDIILVRDVDGTYGTEDVVITPKVHDGKKWLRIPRRIKTRVVKKGG